MSKMIKVIDNHISLIRYLLYALSMISGVMTLINHRNLVYMIIAVMIISTFEIFTELLSQNKKLIKIFTNLVVLILFTYIYINIK